jgi:Zn-dependent peptidase ImmA (M78 family)
MQEKKPFNILGRQVPLVIDNLVAKEQAFGIYDKEKIIIDESLDGVEYLVTEVHEFNHAVADRLGLTLTSIHPDIWEIICEGFARALVENYKLERL